MSVRVSLIKSVSLTSSLKEPTFHTLLMYTLVAENFSPEYF